MTEVPEHLLARAKARRSGGTAPAAAEAAATPATQEAAATPAAAAPKESAPAKAPEPVAPWIEAAKSRHKTPVWAAALLVFLPIWAVVYMTTNDKPSPKTAGPLVTGASVYATNCAGCHGGTGGGGVGPQLSGGAVLKTFETPASQIRWVLLGTAGYQTEGTATYGTANKPVGGGGVMPGWATLEAADVLAVVRHERETLSGEAYDQTAWEAAVEELKADPNPAVAEKAAEFETIVKGWASLPA